MPYPSPVYAISAYNISLGDSTQGAGILIGSTLANLAGIFVAIKTGLFEDKKD